MTGSLLLPDYGSGGTIRPVAAIARTGAILPSLFARTTDGPMAEVKALAAEIGAREGLTVHIGD